MSNLTRGLSHLRRFSSKSTSNLRAGLLGVPLDLGGNWPRARGVEMGPHGFRVAMHAVQDTCDRIAQIHDYGDVNVPRPPNKPAKSSKAPVNAHFLKEISQVAQQVRDSVIKINNDGCLPIMIGGDHSMSAGSLAGAHHTHNNNIGVIWIDAHADFNTPESSPSGNVHGMPLAAACGRGHALLTEDVMNGNFLDESKVVLIGLRDVDEGEKENLRNSNVTCFTMADVDALGMPHCIERAIEIASHGTEGFHCSFDLDSIDPMVAPGVGTPVRGGLTYREAQFAVEKMHDSNTMLSIDFAEINPLLDRENSTASLAVELMLSALGKKTL